NRRSMVAARPTGPSDDRYTRVAEATPTRFAELVVDIGRRRTVNPLRMARAAALVAVAGHEAAVAAAHTALPDGPPPASKDAALGRPLAGVDNWGVERPKGTLPPEVVSAAAQRTVGCSIYPPECERFERLADIAVYRLLGTGAYWPSTIDAAVRLGDAVGDAVLAHARTDGAAPWTPAPGDLPAGSTWVPTPGMFAPPLEPFAGSWRPWNFESGSQFRPKGPPPVDSSAFRAAVRQVLVEGTNLSDRNLRVVRYWDLGPGTSTPPGYWVNDVAADSLRNQPVADQASALAVLATAEFDAGVAVWDAKYHFGLIRPVSVIRSGPSPQWLPSLQTPPFPSYVSGHAAFAVAAAIVMAVVEPSRAEEFYDAAAEAADSRVRGGIHYWFDEVDGASVGASVAAAALRTAGLSPARDIEPIADRLVYTSAAVRTGGRTP
ncbi:MAG: vanadium-dependent haloperoxidase, partial [Actinomycetes bacterium]